MPLPPAHLAGAALEEWDRVARILFNIGVLTEIDRPALAVYCEAYGMWVDAANAFAAARAADPDRVRAGMYVDTKAGGVMQNPLLGIRNKARFDTLKAAVELGMTPVSRSRITANPPAPESDPAAKYFDS